MKFHSQNFDAFWTNSAAILSFRLQALIYNWGLRSGRVKLCVIADWKSSPSIWISGYESIRLTIPILSSKKIASSFVENPGCWISENEPWLVVSKAQHLSRLAKQMRFHTWAKSAMVHLILVHPCCKNKRNSIQWHLNQRMTFPKLLWNYAKSNAGEFWKVTLIVKF